MGVLEDHLVKLQKLGEVIEGTPEERYEKFLGYCRTKDAAASLWVEATNRRRKVMDTWKSR